MVYERNFRALRYIRSAAAAVLLAVSTGWAESSKPVWMVVTRPALAAAIEPLAQQRRQEGFEVVISTDPPSEVLSKPQRRVDFLLLVGDDAPNSEAEPWYVPAARKPLYRWRATQRTTFASDAAWGDLDGDGLPDIPVGRIPARSSEQVEAVVAKILRYQQRPATAEDLRVIVWGGSPGYGRAINALATSMLIRGLEQQFPPWATPWVIAANPRHSLCGWPADQPQQFLTQFRAGAGLCVMMGHARRASFHSMTHEGAAIGLTADDIRTHLANGPPGPPTVVFSCDSGDFTTAETSLTEAMLFAPAGAVAAIGATTESHPLPNALVGACLSRALIDRPRRIGTLWLDAQRNGRKVHRYMLVRALRDVEGSLEESINTDALRRDGALMYALLGDPAMPLHVPRPLKIHTAPDGDGWRWYVEKPPDGAGVIAGHRVEPYLLPDAAAPDDRDGARRAFRQANAAFEYKPLQSVERDGRWSGVVNEPGMLRVIIPSHGRLRVGTTRLTSSPADR